MCGTSHGATAPISKYVTTQVAGAAGSGVGQTVGQVNQMATQVAGAAGAGATAHSHGVEPKIPSKDSPVIQKYLADGSYGPTVKEGKAKTVKIPDGKGFGGIEGRKQNDDDKKQNNYSVTDANFYPALGVLNDASTGKPMNYVKQIQAYNAAGYISTFHPDVYQRMVQVQDAGQGTILGMSLNLMGVEGAQVDPGMAAGGLQGGTFAAEQVPGSPVSARKVIMNGEDLTGEQWARPHHAESSWGVYKQLTDAGLDWKTSMVLSGDDAVSGSGRLNGFNNQDGNTGLNDDEKAIYRIGATVQQSTGVPVIQIMAGGHSHTGLDESAKTNPAINKLIGLPKGDRSNSPERLALIQQALLDGTVKGGDAKKFKVEDEHDAFKGVGGTPEVLDYAISTVAAAKGKNKAIDIPGKPLQAAAGGHSHAATTQAGGATALAGADAAAPAVALGGGAGAPTTKAGGGCGMGDEAKAGATTLAGGGGADTSSVAAILQNLISTLSSLAAAVSGTSVAGASGGGAPLKTTPIITPAPVAAAKAQDESVPHTH